MIIKSFKNTLLRDYVLCPYNYEEKDISNALSNKKQLEDLVDQPYDL